MQDEEVAAAPSGNSAADYAAKLRASVRRAALELAVIFFGVYAAFALSQYEERRDLENRKAQIQQALVSEIQDISEVTRNFGPSLNRQLAAFDSAVAVGGRPPLEPWTEAVRVDTHMWEVTLQSGALSFFDVSTVHQLSDFYNELNAGFGQLEQLRLLSASVLIPNMDRPADEFYDARTRALKPKYEWHRAGFGRLAVISADITRLGDSLVKSLQADTVR